MRGLIVSFVVVIALATACASLKDKHAEALRDSRLELSRSPGQPAPSMRYAGALTRNLNEREASDRVIVTDDEIKFAADNLEQAAERVPEEAPGLWRQEGDLWLAARDADKAEVAYRKSLKAKPDKQPLWALIGIAGRRNNTEQVRALCVEGASAVPDGELRDHVSTCAGAAGLTSSAAALEWLKDEDKKRHDEWFAKAREAEKKQQEEAAEKKKKYDVCSAVCGEKRAACASQCRPPREGQVDTCAAGCVEVEEACKKTCAVSVQ